MQKKKSFQQIVEEVNNKDSRYKPDAYEFIVQALHFTQGRLKKEGHISGKELLEGAREFVIEQYGPMAKAVLAHWGVNNTEDFGNIVFNLIHEKALSKTDTDSIDDFRGIYDFTSAFGNVLRDSILKDGDGSR